MGGWEGLDLGDLMDFVCLQSERKGWSFELRCMMCHITIIILLNQYWVGNGWPNPELERANMQAGDHTSDLFYHPAYQASLLIPKTSPFLPTPEPPIRQPITPPLPWVGCKNSGSVVLVFCIFKKSWISMSSYGSSQSEDLPNNGDAGDKPPFQYDYFLSKSVDLLLSWNESAHASQKVDPAIKNTVYLREEAVHLRQVDKFRTVSIIRTNAFIHTLKNAFLDLSKRFAALFHPQTHLHTHQDPYYAERLLKLRELERELSGLLAYLQVVLDEGMPIYYTGEDSFEQGIFQVVSSLYTFVADPRLLWDLLGAEAHLVDFSSPHMISLGGNYSYYQNLLRSFLKRSLHLRQVYERVQADLQPTADWKNSLFIVKAVSLTWALPAECGVEERERRDFLDCLKGLYFQRLGLQSQDLYYRYIFSSLHLQYLETHRMFKNYAQLQETFIMVMERSKKQAQLMDFVQALELNLLPFEKRKQAPRIEQLALQIIENYIGAAKHILNENNLFIDIPMRSGEQVFACTRRLLQKGSSNGLVDLLMRIQERSKEAFSLGGLEVHRLYLRMIDLLKHVYLSFQHANWLFPPDLLLYIPLHHLIDISDDIRQEVKKTLFTMVSALGEDQLARRVGPGGEAIGVSRGEQLQVVLFFLEACRRDEEYLMLPQVLPRNLQTSVLYVKSLQARLGLKEPPADQKSYIIQNLRFCEEEKVSINFTWFQSWEKMEDRVMEFNLEKQLAEEWMRQLYREAINQRENQRVSVYLQKYRAGKLGLIQMSEMLRYNHGINIWDSVKDMGSVTLKQDDIFDLLEMIRVPLLPNFDIFALSLDQQISLNYAHICLGLYNISFKEAQGNQVYQLIFNKIMKQYIVTPNSSQTKFRTKYPCFFQKWIYTFQLPELFNEVASFMTQHGSNPDYTKDAVEKVHILRDFLQAIEKERIDNGKVMTLDTLTTSLIQFATTLAPDALPQLTIAAIDLYCLLLHRFLSGSEEISVDFIVNAGVLSRVEVIEQALKHVKVGEPRKNWEPSLLNQMLQQLPFYMNDIGLRRTFQVISTYLEIMKPEADQEDPNIKTLFEHILQSTPNTFLDFLLQFLVRMRKLVSISRIRKQEEQKSGEKRVLAEQEKMSACMEGSLGVLRELKKEGKCSLQGLNLTDVVFLDDLVSILSPSRHLIHEGLREVARTIVRELLDLSSKDDLMYLAERLEMLQLVLCGGAREEELLVALIVDNRHREVQTELLKKILRESRKLSEAANRAIDILSHSPEKIHSYHINRLIQINSRYPSERIERFLIANLSCERNNSPAKINQKYLAIDLSRLLEKVPKRPCEQLLLKPTSGEERDRLIELVNAIFEKLLYLPLKKFENISLATVQEADDEEWGTDSQGEEEQPTAQEKKSKGKQREKEHSQSSGMEQEHPDPQGEDSISVGSDISDNEDNYYRPDFLQIFTSEDRIQELKLYETIMRLREEVDVMVDSDYSLLNQRLKGKDGHELELKLMMIVDELNTMTGPFVINNVAGDFMEQICLRMPDALYLALKLRGMCTEISEDQRDKMAKYRQPSKNKPKWLQQFFSDRAESDDSEVSQNDDEQYGEDEEQEYYNDEEDDDQDEDMEDEEQQGGNWRNEAPVRKKPSNPKGKNNRSKREMDEQPPELLPTYSKIEEQMNGGELKREELVKLLEIALYMLLRLPQSQVRCRQVSSFYLELLSTSFGQPFLQSFFTALRFDQTGRNLQAYAGGLDKECGLQEVSMEDAINNVLFLLREWEQKEQSEKGGNMLFKESGTLLPIAEEMIARFQLPLQNNCLTLLLIYIATNKAKIRSKIAALNFSLQGGQLSQGQKEYRLSKKELSRIIDSICRHRSSNRIWEVIEQTMGLKVKLSTKLLQCIRGYGSSLNQKVKQVGGKIAAALAMAQQGQRVEESHHIVSRLVQSCRDEIKQFYFINKETLIQIFNEENLLPDDCDLKQLPRLLLKLKEKLMTNSQLIGLTQAMFYFLKLLRERFYGKIQDKLFQRLIHYPKMLVEVSWYYIFMFCRSGGAIWTSPSQIAAFFEKYTQIGSYSFKGLQEVFNLVLHFLQLESFCSDKFKELLIPVLMRNTAAAQQVGLRFKIPRGDDDIDTQNILVTRKCSFDMAFYQVTGQAIAVEFHEEEGSDHGGLVRELMIGWRGRGVGEEAFFIGKILGISFRQGVPYGGALDLGMFVAITNFTPTIDFFQQVDPEIYRSLVFIRDTDPSDLCLRFVVEKEVNGKIREFELVQGGAEIELTNANKEKYLSAYCEKYFRLGREQELKEIETGFYSVVYADYARIFIPQQMLRQIRGEEVVDAKMLVSKARYEGYSEESPIIKWFWEIVEGFSQDLMNTFIQFVTGSPKITVFNSNFNITIEKVYDINCLPVAHTCFNTLDLPEYSTKEILQSKLITAICEGNNSFGIL